jgi:hypothetical protein
MMILYDLTECIAGMQIFIFERFSVQHMTTVNNNVLYDWKNAKRVDVKCYHYRNKCMR